MSVYKATSGKPAGPNAMVIFGAAGDLTKRLVMPSVYNLACSKLLPEQFAIVGMDLAQMSDEEWEKSLEAMLREFVAGSSKTDDFDAEVWNWMKSRMTYLQGDLNDPAAYDKLKSKLEELDSKQGTAGNYLFYFAIADRFFAPAAEHIAKSGLGTESDGHWRRIVVEKPFGHDLASAQELNRRLLGAVGETQIFRIDHFLGKETVQNMMMFRFANGLFEPIWNRDRINHVQITVAETVGVEQRGKFYEATGALRDMVPNHLFQLLAMTAMEAPNSFAADPVRTEKAKVIEAIRICSPDQVDSIAVRGQYDAGNIADKEVPGYRSEANVASDSGTETFVAMKLLIDNWRWSGVPFYIRTGKRMARRKTQVAIHFKQAPSALLRNTAVHEPTPNWLLLRIQPDEGIALEFGAKIPGPEMKLGDVRMDFKYEDYFGTRPNTGYETLIYDVMIGDAMLFQRADNIEDGWRVVQPVIDEWGAHPPTDFPNYAAGSQGPAVADELLARDGFAWRPIS